MNNIAKRIILDIDDLANDRDVSEKVRIEELDFFIKESQKLKDVLSDDLIRKLSTLARTNIPAGPNPLRNV